MSVRGAPALLHRTYRFAGFARPEEARSLCGTNEYLAMPKTTAQQENLQAAIEEAIQAGYMSRIWPKDTLWLGASWSSSRHRWEWDDGTPASEIRWAQGQPSSAPHQELEPYLCLLSTGEFHDSDPPYAFGVMCEAKVSRKWADAGKDSDKATNAQTQTSARQGELLNLPSYRFLGFASGPMEARRLCGQRTLPMPKTSAELTSLLAFIKQVIADGRMKQTWPQNTLWMGGHWSPRMQRWVWDDQESIAELDWAPGQPSSSGAQSREPWLCMLANGQFHDSDVGVPLYSFGVVCEAGDVGRAIVEKDAVHETTETSPSGPSLVGGYGLALASAGVLGGASVVRAARRRLHADLGEPAPVHVLAIDDSDSLLASDVRASLTAHTEAV